MVCLKVFQPLSSIENSRRGTYLYVGLSGIESGTRTNHCFPSIPALEYEGPKQFLYVFLLLDPTSIVSSRGGIPSPKTIMIKQIPVQRESGRTCHNQYWFGLTEILPSHSTRTSHIKVIKKGWPRRENRRAHPQSQAKSRGNVVAPIGCNR